MRNSVLETDGQTDGEKIALVELHFAAKNEAKEVRYVKKFDSKPIERLVYKKLKCKNPYFTVHLFSGILVISGSYPSRLLV